MPDQKHHGKKHDDQQVDTLKCPKSLDEMCAKLDAWGTAWETWGKKVKRVVDECCGDGGPETLPPPPKPPFH